MEIRKITICSERTQSSPVDIQTDVTTLRELKSLLRERGIDYSGLTFYEAYSKSELLSDDTILPHGLPYKGTVTDDLVIMLAVPNKKIKSGSCTDRNTIYTMIKDNNLEDSIKATFGKNFTNCKTSELEEFLKEHLNGEDMSADFSAIITRFLNVLENEDIITSDQSDYILSGKCVASKDYLGEYRELFDFIND